MRKLLVLFLAFSGCAGLQPDEPLEVAELDLQLSSADADWLEPPLSVAEAKSVKSGFAWGSALPERDQSGQHALRYMLIGVRSREELEALDIMRVHWDMLPLFPEEKTKWAGKRGLVTAAT